MRAVFWLVPVLSRILVANVLAAWLLKKTVGLHARMERFAVQMVFSFLIALAIAATVSPISLNRLTLLLTGFGVLNGLAAYCHWKAIDQSMSKSYLFAFGDDLIAMGLGIIFIGQERRMTLSQGLGITLCLTSVVLLGRHAYRMRHALAREKTTQPSFLFFVGIYSAVWGVATFLMRYLNLRQVGIGTFLSTWYGGTVIAALLLLAVARVRRRSSARQRLQHPDLIRALVLSCCATATVGLGYLSYRFAPITIAQPIFLIAEQFLPTAMGLFLFHERKHLDASERTLFTLGLVGGLIVALTYTP